LSITEIQLLSFLIAQPNGSADISSVANLLGADVASALTEQMLSKGYIGIADFTPSDGVRLFRASAYCITAKGRLALEKHHQRQAEEEKHRSEADVKHDKEVRQNRKHQYLVALFQFFLGVISGLFLEHCAQIVAFVTELIEAASFHT